MIFSQEQLDELVSSLARHRVIGLDTEADSLHSYREKMCLVQISSPDGSWLIDPLADIDLSHFFSSLTDHRIIIHGADYDLRLLARDGHFHAEKIFDTSIAGRFIGLGQVGYGALVQHYFGVTLNKSSQRANWGRRPIPPQMTDYALNDVRYLLELGSILEAKLKELGRWDWFIQTCNAMVENARRPITRDADQAWRIKGSNKLNPRESAVLRALWHWRESEAEAWNKPTFYVLSNDSLIETASTAVAGGKISFPKMPNPRFKRLREAIRAALEIPESEWPIFEKVRRERTSKEDTQRFEDLRQHRDKTAEKIGLEPSLLGSRTALMEYVLNKTFALLPWQMETLGLSPRNSEGPVE